MTLQVKLRAEIEECLRRECPMNRGVWIACVVCGLVGTTTRADDPKLKTETKPPWQRLLKGDDAKKAAELGKRIEELEAADKYAEAISQSAELLALRTKVQGVDHWETVNEKWTVTALKKVAALPEQKRTGWRKASRGNAQAKGLEQKAHYVKALSLRQERLKWCRQVLGEEHPDTARNYANVAVNLDDQGKYAEAGPLHQKALDIRRKVLGEDHPDTAKSYDRVAANLNVQGKYAEAAPLYQKALDIRRKALGEDHPDTASSFNNVAVNLDDQGKYAEAAPLYKKSLDIYRKVQGEDHLDTATSYNNVAYNLDSQGKYAEAGPLYQKALNIWRKVLGEDHPFTATSYNNVAANLDNQGKYTEAGPLYQKALDIRRKALGEDHPDTASSYNNLAYNLNAQGKYAEAGPLYQKALDIRRKALGEDHPDTASSYNNVAVNLNDQGKYAEAGPLYQKALDIRRKALGEDHPDTASSYNNLAVNLSDQGKHAEARPLYQKALDINRKALGEDHPDTARSYNNVADNLNAQGKYAEAGPLYHKALDIWRKVLGEDHRDTATSYDNVAHNLAAEGKYAEAAPLDQKALAIRRKVLGEDHPDTARSYNNVAGNLNDQGKYAEAGPLYHKALDIWRKVLGEDHPHTTQTYNNVALNLQAQGMYGRALVSLEAGARSYEAARLTVASGGLERSAFGAERSPYELLAAGRSRAGRSGDAWAALEADLARGLLDEIALRRGIGLTPAEQQQRDELLGQRTPLEARVLVLVSRASRTPAESAELGRLIEKRQKLEESLGKLAVAVNRREVAALAQLQATLSPDAALLAWVDVSDKSGGVQEHWGCIVRPKGDPRWEHLPGSGPDRKWTKEDTDMPARFRAALARSAPAAEIEALAKRLHAQRLAPLEKHLVGVKSLFVAPVRQMSGIPVEALTDQYTISYTPSGTYLARLKDREPPHGTELLAVGDPVFSPANVSTQLVALPPGGLLVTQVIPDGNADKSHLRAGDVLVSYAGEYLTSVEQFRTLVAAQAGAKAVVVKVWREGQSKVAERELAPGTLGVMLAKEPAREAIAARRQSDQMLAQLTRGEEYAELPGTQVEIARLAGLFDAKAVTTLTRTDASEQRLDELRKAGQLKKFRYLHFATHGKANSARAFDSALMLTRPAKLPEPRVGEPYLDGRLTAAEVLEYWKLDAELVTLSACESGLGRQGGGDGLLGFAQSFLLAGSRAVCLTLWEVDDTAAALLIDRFYRNLLGKGEDGAKPMGKAAALHEAKHWLRNLAASEALDRLGTITDGVVRGQRPAREEMKDVPKLKAAAPAYKPYAHPRYWAAFILIGDPD
jgi:tetratricopeptide (TPR) repeat protein